jgi:hypothetical protein
MNLSEINLKIKKQTISLENIGGLEKGRILRYFVFFG